jgi:hypothetical protein
MGKLARILRACVAAGAFVVGPGVAAQAADAPTAPDQVPGANEAVPVPFVPGTVTRSWRPGMGAGSERPGIAPTSGSVRFCQGGARGRHDRLHGRKHGPASPRQLDRPTDPGQRCSLSRERPQSGRQVHPGGNDRRNRGRNDLARLPVLDREAEPLALVQPEPRGEAEHFAAAQPEPRRKGHRDPVALRQGAVGGSDDLLPRPGLDPTVLGENRYLAQPVNGLDLSPLAGYGVVGMLATLGLVFAGRQWLISERERKALSDRVDALADKLLDQSERHKAELLDIYRAVGPGLQSMASTLTDYREFLAQQRMDKELERARKGGARGAK